MSKPTRATRYATEEERRAALKANAQRFRNSEAGKAYVSRANRKAALKRLGLTVEQYDAMLAAQGGRCAGCGTDKPSPRPDVKFMFVDHCHRTGKVRGLLCGPCNTALGYLKDSPETLEALARYVRAHN